MPNVEQLIQQAIDKARAETPRGYAVKFAKEDFAEIAADYPELSERLERILGKAKIEGTGTTEEPKPEAVTPPVAMTPDAIKEAAKQAFKEEREAEKAAEAAAALKVEHETLKTAYPNYREILGSPEKDGDPPIETDWRKWLATQPDAEEVRTTWSWARIKESIDKFTASTKAPSTPAKPTRADMRRAVNEDAVTPRTDGGAMHIEPPPSAVTEFHKAFGDTG